jgi:predicted transglutaminase-like cysteine proteinase
MLSTRQIIRRSLTFYLPVAIFVFCCVPPALAQLETDGPFGLSTVATPEAPLAMTWQKLLLEVNEDLSTITRCRANAQSCSPAAAKFVALVREGERPEPLAQIGHINRAANFAMRLLGAAHADNEWRSPLVALARTVGDCKHYAVLKYAALRAAGFAPDALKIVVVDVRSTHQQHAVVAIRIKERHWHILDNSTSILVESSMALDRYDPLYELDQDGIRQFALPSRPLKIVGSIQRSRKQ